MAYVGTPEFESRRPALKATFEKSRQELEARLALIEAETEVPVEVMSPADLSARLVAGEIPKE